MSDESLENYIRMNCAWEKLPPRIKNNFSRTAWEHEVLQFSLKNQLKWSTGLVRKFYLDEKRYYEELLKMSKANLMLYPYHLSEVLIRGLKVTPMLYYLDMIHELMMKEKSYDSLPNFTATDCVRLLGIGRNEYIDIVNQCKAATRGGFWNVISRKKNVVRENLPKQPVDFNIEHWWIIRLGQLQTNESLSQEEEYVLSSLIQSGGMKACEIDKKVLSLLCKKDMVYIDVPVEDSDTVSVPPLEGFVMNRVLGDNFENLLYKIFVSIDENTTVLELGNLLQVDISMVKDAVSIYCRLGFAFKKGVEVRKNSKESTSWHSSWAEQLIEDSSTIELSVTRDGVYQERNSFEMSRESTDKLGQNKRIGFLFDSTLTAFLMMGNLSSGLKSHAVTMFEVGKLTDESLESFINELSTIENVSEGEVQRYYEHAITLYQTLIFLRKNQNLITNGKPGLSLDLIRYESLSSLDSATCQRVLSKNYEILVSMAPISSECRTLRSAIPPHIGPAIPEANSIWFKLYLYQTMGRGPQSIFFVKGTRVKKIPSMIKKYSKVLLTPWEHESEVVGINNFLVSLNEMLCQSPVLVQGYQEQEKFAQVVNVPFPIATFSPKTEDQNRQYEILSQVEEKFNLSCSFGYVTMMKLNILQPDSEGGDWIAANIHYGLPLFDSELNGTICRGIVENGLLDTAKLRQHMRGTRELVINLLEFISANQDFPLNLDSEASVSLFPTRDLVFDGEELGVFKV